jgi:hypothetical protein
MTHGGIVVRAGDPDSDRELAVQMFVRYLNPRYDEARFDWVYRQNPHGRGRLWVATDPTSGEAVGIAGAFPRRMSVFGRDELAWLLGDFCVSDAYRSVGPALALQRACLAEVGAGGIPFCYDFPSSGMMAVYRRLRINPLGHMVRLRMVLRVDTRLRELVANRAISRSLSAVANLFLAPRRAQGRSASGLEVSLHASPLGREFTELNRQMANPKVVMVERSAEYLSWRYLANPVHRYEVLTARQADRMVGYAVFRQDDRTMTLVDVFPDPRGATTTDLVQGAVRVAWRRGLEAVDISLLESSPWISCLKEAGFKQRETLPVVVYAPRDGTQVGTEMNWFLSDGDRDS